jgi:hypothetical protein
MSRKHRSNRPLYLNAMQRAIESSAKLPEKDRKALRRIAESALNGMRFGIDCVDCWRTLADAFNVAEALAEFGICSDVESKARIAGGQAGLSAVHGRHQSDGKWTLYSAELVAFNEAVWLHGIQLEHCSLGEYEKAMRRVIERTRQALAGNIGPGVQVLEAR